MVVDDPLPPAGLVVDEAAGPDVVGGLLDEALLEEFDVVLALLEDVTSGVATVVLLPLEAEG